MLQHVSVSHTHFKNILGSISLFRESGTQCQSTNNTGSLGRSSRDSSVTFSHTMCGAAQVTRLVLAELCDALRAGHQHAVHVWYKHTHTHADKDTVPPWSPADTLCDLTGEQWWGRVMKQKQINRKNPLFTPHSCLNKVQHVSEMKIYFCLSLPATDLKPEQTTE